LYAPGNCKSFLDFNAFTKSDRFSEAFFLVKCMDGLI